MKIIFVCDNGASEQQPKTQGKRQVDQAHNKEGYFDY